MKLDLDKLEKLYEQAEQGEWHTVEKPWRDDELGTWIIAGSFDPHIGKPVCDSMEILEWDADQEGPDYSQSDANMEAIVAIHNAFPLMVREIRHLRAMVQALKSELSIHCPGREQAT